MVSILKFLAVLGDYIPSPPKPARRPDLKFRFLFTAATLMVYYAMASVMVYPLVKYNIEGIQLPALINVVFASQQGTIAQLGIGPIVTAGLILQILVGAKILDIDMSDPSSRKLFTQSQKGLAVLIAVVEGLGFAMYYRLNLPLTLAIFMQFFTGALILLIIDEAIQKGWGIGSGVSLFILAGVARTIAWDAFAPIKVPGTDQYHGFFPYLFQGLFGGGLSNERLFYGLAEGVNRALPSLPGFITVVILSIVLVYLQSVKVNIPVTTQRAPGIRTKVPLQFLYVTNIPILLVGILFSDLILFYNISSTYLANSVPWVSEALSVMITYLAPPNSLLEIYVNPLRVLIYSLLLVGLAVVFGYMWVEIAGLNPETQAENLIKSGLEIPGIRRNPKVLESILARYIYPLTVLSSIIVALVALTADIFSAFGTGTGILLSIGILQQYYTTIAYERTLEAYPLLKRLIGE
ncbi:MAG: preprotein translocase subunit SecY [Sulfolobales archaeon]